MMIMAKDNYVCEVVGIDMKKKRDLELEKVFSMSAPYSMRFFAVLTCSRANHNLPNSTHN